MTYTSNMARHLALDSDAENLPRIANKFRAGQFRSRFRLSGEINIIRRLETRAFNENGTKKCYARENDIPDYGNSNKRLIDAKCMRGPCTMKCGTTRRTSKMTEERSKCTLDDLCKLADLTKRRGCMSRRVAEINPDHRSPPNRLIVQGR